MKAEIAMGGLGKKLSGRVLAWHAEGLRVQYFIKKTLLEIMISFIYQFSWAVTPNFSVKYPSKCSYDDILQMWLADIIKLF